MGAGFELVELGNGLHTLRDLETGEKFHPVVGPMAEAKAIHIAPLRLARWAERSFTIWDVGLGAAANAVALLEELLTLGRPFDCKLVSFERTLEPLRFALDHAEQLKYLVPWAGALRCLAKTNAATIKMPGGGEIEWTLRLEDFTETSANPKISAPDAVIYDPYSPLKNPTMWSLDHFSLLRKRLTNPAILTSYSRSTAVRVTLLLAGFFTGIGHATGEKEQTTLAATDLDLLENPLDAAWLDRVRRSTASRPLGHGNPGPISAEDLTRLEAHSQFHR